jgi:hypothetical protein
MICLLEGHEKRIFLNYRRVNYCGYSRNPWKRAASWRSKRDLKQMHNDEEDVEFQKCNI